MTEDVSIPIRVRAEIASLPIYQQGKPASASAFKLSSNENPFPPLPSVVQALAEQVTCNRYPDATATRLRTRLAEKYGCTPEGVHIGAGSVSILAQLMLAVLSPGDEVVYPWRSFEAYPGLVLVASGSSVQVPLTDDARHDLDAMAAAITERTRAILLCSPNNPTGPALSQAEVEGFLQRVPSNILVILDEAYAEFVTDPNAVDGLGSGLLQRHRNLVVLRTFSKAYGLAGLRVGYAVGDPRLLDVARATAIPLSVTAQAEAAALASLDAEEELMERVAELVQRRVKLVSALREAGWTVPEAQGNFVWLATGKNTMKIAEHFAAGGIIARPFAGEGIRISVGEEESLLRVAMLAELL